MRTGTMSSYLCNRRLASGFLKISTVAKESLVVEHHLQVRTNSQALKDTCWVKELRNARSTGGNGFANLFFPNKMLMKTAVTHGFLPTVHSLDGSLSPTWGWRWGSCVTDRSTESETMCPGLDGMLKWVSCHSVLQKNSPLQLHLIL